MKQKEIHTYPGFAQRPRVSLQLPDVLKHSGSIILYLMPQSEEQHSVFTDPMQILDLKHAWMPISL